jgi:hypothetical protein
MMSERVHAEGDPVQPPWDSTRRRCRPGGNGGDGCGTPGSSCTQAIPPRRPRASRSPSSFASWPTGWSGPMWSAWQHQYWTPCSPPATCRQIQRSPASCSRRWTTRPSSVWRFERSRQMALRRGRRRSNHLVGSWRPLMPLLTTAYPRPGRAHAPSACLPRPAKPPDPDQRLAGAPGHLRVGRRGEASAYAGLARSC